MDRQLAERMSGIAPFHVMDIIARVYELEKQGRSIVHMEVGEPDFTTAEPIVAAAQQALAEGRTRYTGSAGINELRQAIADHYQKHYQVSLPPTRILVTPGASGALQLATGVLINPGDEVLMADPGYPCNRHFVRFVGGVPVTIPVGPDRAYQLDAELVERHWSDKTVAVLLASPSNPTGTLVTRQVLEQILQVIERVEKRKGLLIMDEIYHGLVYEDEATSALMLSDRVFVVNSFSKYFGMTGWRLGWLVAPADYVRDVEKLAQNLFLSPSAPAQYAALAAFTEPAEAIFGQRRAAFQQRRDYLLPALRELGFIIPVTPQGAFYLYADCSQFSNDSFAFAMRLLEEAGVAVAPGIDFGSYRANSHIRFAYTSAIENLVEGVARLRNLLS